ncbi:MAG: V-type ATPase subunit [Candidatus Lokiarchaeota archaeon]|nr:V-type ATPase subunit [Candidatus Lokiarchaeota archaeon]
MLSIIIPSYSYTFIKIDYLKNLIIDDDTLSRLKTIYDIETFIETIKPFYPNIEVKEFTIEEIEGVLFNNYIQLIGKIQQFSPINMRNFLRNYLMKFEIQNIKQVIISLIIGMKQEERRSNINFLVEVYLDNTEFIEDLLKLTTVDEIQIYLKKSLYNIPIREGLLYFKKNKEIFVLEAFLDQLYFNHLNEQVKNLDKKEKIMISLFVKYKTEIYNLNLIYRGIKNRIDKKLLSQFLVDNYLFLNEDKLKYLLNQDNPEDFLSIVDLYLKNITKADQIFITLKIDTKHIIRSIEQFYITYYFKKFKIKIDDIDFSTISKILEVLIKKEKEIKFDILPRVIKIIHKKFKVLKKL